MAAPARSFARRPLAAATFAAALFALPSCNSILEDLADSDNIPPMGPGMTVGFPLQWGGSPRGQFEVGVDTDAHRSGVYSAYIRTTTTKVFGDQFGTIAQTIRADAYRGTRVRMTAWIRTYGLSGEGAGLWLRTDGPGPQSFDNMADRRLTGTAEWREASIVADIPHDAIGIAFGAIIVSPGMLWADDFRFEIVDASVPVTAGISAPSADTAAVARIYDRTPMGPRNLDFEGVIHPSGRPETIAWVKNQSFAFTTDDPAVPSNDLEPLRAMIGNARIVALGEATHGTREFFRMKHRMLEWLVREMDFTHFAIEATFPEALDVDHYVQTGEGDAARVLENLHFWTWNTTEVLDMIRWMRAWNAAGNQPRVHFVGFDMQFPGVALDSVGAFVRRIDPAAGVTVDDAYHCLNQLREFPSMTGSKGLDDYMRQTPDYRVRCRMSLQAVDTLLARREAEWGAQVGAEKIQLVRRMARLVSQWEYSQVNDLSGVVIARDLFMAENVAWWHDVQTGGAKMVLWAHNMHISRVRGWMGDLLSKRYGAAYLNIGQTFGSGSFNSVLIIPRPDTLPALRSHSVLGVRDESIESVFNNTEIPRLVFDARRLRTTTDVAAIPLTQPMSIRSIGAAFNPLIGSTGYQVALTVRNDYDLIVWFANGTASELLPFSAPPASMRWKD